MYKIINNFTVSWPLLPYLGLVINSSEDVQNFDQWITCVLQRQTAIQRQVGHACVPCCTSGSVALNRTCASRAGSSFITLPHQYVDVTSSSRLPPSLNSHHCPIMLCVNCYNKGQFCALHMKHLSYCVIACVLQPSPLVYHHGNSMTQCNMYTDEYWWPLMPMYTWPPLG